MKYYTPFILLGFAIALSSGGIWWSLILGCLIIAAGFGIFIVNPEISA